MEEVCAHIEATASLLAVMRGGGEDANAVAVSSSQASKLGQLLSVCRGKNLVQDLAKVGAKIQAARFEPVDQTMLMSQISTMLSRPGLSSLTDSTAAAKDIKKQHWDFRDWLPEWVWNE